MGSTGDLQTGARLWATPQPQQPRKAKGPSLLARGALAVPPGESPGGTGQWPVLPKNEFPDTLCEGSPRLCPFACDEALGDPCCTRRAALHMLAAKYPHMT